MHFLIRGGCDPHNSYTVKEICTGRILGDNLGNIAYLNGVIRTIVTQDDSYDLTNYKKQWTEKEADEINERYDALIIPYADAFRSGFETELEGYTKLINRLKIPVIVIGVGLRAPYSFDPMARYPFDDVVKNFVKAVLDHSSSLGLRGEITGNYLHQLGFIQDKDFTPIGCPSLYMKGGNVTTKELPPIIEKIAYSMSYGKDFNAERKFINDAINATDGVLMWQTVRELCNYYYNANYEIDGFTKEYLRKINCKTKSAVFFEIESWINYLSTFDLSVGMRFHGTVMSTLAGLPHVFIPTDARTIELARYHHFTQITPEQISLDSRLSNYLDKLDFKSFQRHNVENIRHYIDFLNDNGLKNTFDEKYNIRKECQNVFSTTNQRITPFFNCSHYERIQRKIELLLLKVKIHLQVAQSKKR